MIALKADLHLHSNEDPIDADMIEYSAKELIDYCSRKGLDIIAITLHEEMVAEEEMKKLQAFAKKRGMLLIPGVEKSIEKAHILIYGATKEDLGNIHTFTDLRELKENKGEHILIGASHPFFPTTMCIGEKYYEYEDCFDFLEWNSFYTSAINYNKKTMMEEKRVIGNSDAHELERIGKTYTNIHTEHYKSHEEFKKHVTESNEQSYNNMVLDVIKMLKSKHTITELKTKPLPYSFIIKKTVQMGTTYIKRKFKKKK
jgi:predicted metal-dependent phosphoesterase TrpH